MSVEMLIWFCSFTSSVFCLFALSLHFIVVTFSLLKMDFITAFEMVNQVSAKMCYIFNFVVLQLSFSGKMLHLK